MSNVRYELTENELQGRGPKVLYLSVSKSGADWLSLSHSHPHTELLFVTSGAGWFRLNGRDYPIRQGNLAVTNPDTVHTEISSPDKPLKCLIVGVENAAFDLRRNGSDGESCPVFDFPGHSDGLSTYLLAIERELSEKSENYLLLAHHLAYALLLYAMRHTGLRAVPKRNKTAVKECAFVRQYIDEHFAEEVSVGELAAKTFTNKYHLIHLFSREYGISPIAYLMERRIEEAGHLLRETRMSVTEISKVTGFSSPSFFAKRFKQSMRVSPLAYRNKGANPVKDYPPPERMTTPGLLSLLFAFLRKLKPCILHIFFGGRQKRRKKRTPRTGIGKTFPLYAQKAGGTCPGLSFSSDL